MFEFERKILKVENRFPMVGYPYKATPITDKAKLFFAKRCYSPYRDVFRMIPKSEQQKFIKENLNLKHSLFSGVVRVYEDMQAAEQEVRRIVIKKMALARVPGIDYASPKDSIKIMNFNVLEYGKDFTIEVGEKITYEQPKQPTFDDIKAL